MMFIADPPLKRLKKRYYLSGAFRVAPKIPMIDRKFRSAPTNWRWRLTYSRIEFTHSQDAFEARQIFVMKGLAWHNLGPDHYARLEAGNLFILLISSCR